MWSKKEKKEGGTTKKRETRKEDIKKKFQEDKLAKERNRTKAYMRMSQKLASDESFRQKNLQAVKSRYHASESVKQKDKKRKIKHYYNHKDKFAKLFGDYYKRKKDFLTAKFRDYYKRKKDFLTAKLWVRSQMNSGTPSSQLKRKNGKKSNQASKEAKADSLSTSSFHCPYTSPYSGAFKKAVQHRMTNDANLSQRMRTKKKRHREFYIAKDRKVQKMQVDLEELTQVLNMHYRNPEESKEDIKLEFARANNVIEMATNSLAKRHALNATKCEKFLDHLPESEPATLEDFTSAMGNLRQHSKYTEAYFFETAYTNYGTNTCRICKSFADDVYTTIPIDAEGCARFFQHSEHEDQVQVKQKCSCSPKSFTPNPVSQNQPAPVNDDWHQFPTSTLDSQFQKASLTYSLPDLNLLPSFLLHDSQHSGPHEQDNDSTSDENSDGYQCSPKQKKMAASEEDQGPTEKNIRWECHNQLCKFNLDDIHACQHFFSRMEQTKKDQLHTNSLIPFYLESLDACKNPLRRIDKLGHSPFCSLETGCYSFLRPMRALKPHFPVLTRFVNDIYKAVVKCKIIVQLNTLKREGSLKQLKNAIKKAIKSLHEVGKANEFMFGPQQRLPIDDKLIKEAYGLNIQKVATLRDEYPTVPCDCCEMLKMNKDLKTLRSYANRKGFDNMLTLVLEKFQQDLPVEEREFANDPGWVNDIKDNFQVCTYCAGKMTESKENARCVFNNLQAKPTPDCIKVLNRFELAMIKFVMNCVTIVRLGQVTAFKRPRNELTDALKGRIVYLPVDVQANAEVLPENLLNIDSFVILVVGQPTYSKIVWTTMIDLRKVHEALLWLRENNRLYANIQAYTLQELEEILDSRLAEKEKGIENPQPIPDEAILKRLTDNAKSELLEHFSVQAIDSTVPKDFIEDFKNNKQSDVDEFQFKKIEGDAENIFDKDLDLKAFPHLFPDGTNGLQETARTFKMRNAEYIKCRLLSRHPQFRLDKNYLFHNFQFQEVAHMCNSVCHMV